jgi:hypothetical protein
VKRAVGGAAAAAVAVTMAKVEMHATTNVGKHLSGCLVIIFLSDPRVESDRPSV